MFDLHQAGVFLCGMECTPVQLLANFFLHVRRDSKILNELCELLCQPVRHVRSLQAARQNAYHVFFNQQLLRAGFGGLEFRTGDLQGRVRDIFRSQLLRRQAL